MNSDCTSLMGYKHKVCEDYARAGSHYILLADGCSGSPDTDFGARLIVKTAENLLNNTRAILEKRFPLLVIDRAFHTASSLHLPQESLDATFLAAIIIDSTLHIICAGDGMIILGRKDGTIHIESVNYKSGFPFYLNYYCNPLRMKIFETYTDSRELESLIIEKNLSIILNNKESRILKFTQHCAFADIPVCDYNYIALLSDGIHSFVEMQKTDTYINHRQVNFREIIKDILNFKNIKGNFVQRRISRFSKQCKQNKYFNNDDFTLCVLNLQEEKNEIYY